MFVDGAGADGSPADRTSAVAVIERFADVPALLMD
jgi:hypothetical protein